MSELNVYKDALMHPVFEYISKAATNLQVDTFVIGGFVRDYFLKRDTPIDIDIVAVPKLIALKVTLPNPPATPVYPGEGSPQLIEAVAEV